MPPAAHSSPSDTTVEQGLRKVPPFPPIAARLLSLLSKENASVTEVAELIAGDPTFSARLLNCVNSAAYGLTSRVVNIKQALALIGLDRARQLTLTVAAAAYTQGALRSNELRRCWEHTVATAFLADEIALACGGAFKDIAYTAGVMHDIGRLGLLTAYPKEYERIIRDAAEQCLDLLDFEREHFGVDHAAAGRMLAERWGLPEEFRVIAGRHHDPCESGELDLLRIVHVACRMADAIGYDVSRPLVPIDVDAVLAELPPKARSRFQIAPEELRTRIELRIRSFDGGRDESESLPEAEPRPAAVSEEQAPAEPEFLIDLSQSAAPNSPAMIAWIVAAVVLVVVVLGGILLLR